MMPKYMFNASYTTEGVQGRVARNPHTPTTKGFSGMLRWPWERVSGDSGTRHDVWDDVRPAAGDRRSRSVGESFA